MAQDLDKLLDRVTAHYQPIVDLGTGAVVGFEALARIAEAGGPASSIGPFIEGIERDPAHLERLMRQILVDYARTHGAAKRGADRMVELDTSVVLPQVRSTDLVALDDALNALAKLDEQQGRIVEMRFFGGLATEEIAGVLGISASTVKRDWNVAKAWLTRQMKKGGRGKTRAVAEG